MAKHFLRYRDDAFFQKSIPQLFVDRCAATPEAVAFRYKDFGLYQEVTWSEYQEKVAECLAGLKMLGLVAGDRVATMSDPCCEFLIADIAAMTGGAICYGIYTTCSVGEVEYQLTNGGAEIFFAEDQEFVDKVLQATDGLPRIKHIVVFDTRALFQYTDPRIISFADLVDLGKRELGHRRREDYLRENAELVAANDLAVIVYTSGTTGPPKGALHNHVSLMWGFGNAYLEAFPELKLGQHRSISHLPMAHLIERSNSICLPLVADVIPHIGEDSENLLATLYEVQPTFLNVVPRILEKLAAQVETAMRRSSPFKRLAFRWAERLGQDYFARTWTGKHPGPVFSGLYWLARALVFRPLLLKMGLSKIQSVLCAGAPLPKKVHEQWQMWGVNVRNLYGITEGGYVLCQADRFPSPAKGGSPIPPREVMLARDGELLVRGPGLFCGYWDNEAATKAALKDGWLCTGDIAAADSPTEFRIVDRKKDIMITSGGKNIAPSEIENLIKGSPYISEVVLIGDGLKFVSALIEIDFGTVSEWARQNKLIYTSFTSLVETPEVVSLIQREIEKANLRLARVEQVKKFRIIPKELDPEEGDTTPTRKIKRKHMHAMFEELIMEMYREAEVTRA
ncbi:MAG: long-chain fatty acid--CoA ligase [Mesorhizobium sp.]|uniref:AMP-dependent synthetase/ligase n=1 Tax=Mesorhizobium sp. TaxID=1871066 RepID=UPI000FE46E93|nr:AMP-binding protein [Mesorhizobium sp.]RWI57111.1 MAG: long-chain fatty acid--CoA ligase [Mesorhizobium sp.]